MRSPFRRAVARRPLATLLTVLLVLGAALAAGCGGDSDRASEGEDVTGLLERALRQQIESADVTLDAQLAIDGDAGFDAPVTIEARGPYVSRERGLPAFDIDLAVSMRGAGQTVRAGLLSTGRRVFVKFGGVRYELSREQVERAGRLLDVRGGGRGFSLRGLGLDPRAWIAEGRSEGETEVAGVQTRHLSARLDARALLADLSELAERWSRADGGVSPGKLGGLGGLTSEQVGLAERLVGNPRLDFHVGVGDEIVRRVSASLELVASERDRELSGGIEGGSLSFSVVLADIDGDQRVEAPADPRPIGELVRRLPGVGGLGVLLGGGGGQTRAPAGDAPIPGPGATPDTDALQSYADCVRRAGPDEAEAIQRCAELLR